VAVAGANVQGSIGGLTTTGLGQELTASNGLRVKVSGTSAGAFGNLEFRQGYGTQIASLVSAALKSDGAIANRTDSWQKSIQGIQAQQTRFNNRLTLIEANLRKQYTALDRTLSSMNSTSTYLTQQLSALQKQNSS
jgi:flagellar hook-associated protein 2